MYTLHTSAKWPTVKQVLSSEIGRCQKVLNSSREGSMYDEFDAFTLGTSTNRAATADSEQPTTVSPGYSAYEAEDSSPSPTTDTSAPDYVTHEPTPT